MSEYINVYIAYGVPVGSDWTYMYQKPETLFNLMYKDKAKTENGALTYFSCPAMADKMKKILVFKNTVPGSVAYDFRDGKKDLSSLTKEHVNVYVTENRTPAINIGPTLTFGMSYNVFADEPLPVYFTPPFFEKPGYTQDATILPGEFDVGSWFRPYHFEVQTWSDHGTLTLKENEPIFYAEFKTDKKIKLQRFVMTEEIQKLVTANVNSWKLFGVGQSLLQRYKRFKDYGMREKVLTEIKKNLIDEDPYIF
jgi:hypothetical protein